MDIRTIELMIWNEEEAKNDSFRAQQTKNLLYYYGLLHLFERLKSKGVNFYFVRFNMRGEEEREILIDPNWYDFEGSFGCRAKDLEKFRKTHVVPWRWKEERKFEEFKDQNKRHRAFNKCTGETTYENYKHIELVYEEAFGLKPNEEPVENKIPAIKKEKAMNWEELRDTFVERARLEESYLEEKKIDVWFKNIGKMIGESLPHVELCYVNKKSVDVPGSIGSFDLEIIVGVRGLLPDLGEIIFSILKRNLAIDFLISKKSFTPNMSIEEQCDLKSKNGVYFEWLQSIEDLKKKITNEEFLLWRNPKFHSIYRYKDKKQKKCSFENAFEVFFILATSARTRVFKSEWCENKVLIRGSKVFKTKVEVRHEGGGNPLLFILDIYMQVNDMYLFKNSIYKKAEGSKYSFVEYSNDIFLFGRNIKEIYLSLWKYDVCSFYFKMVDIDGLLQKNLQWYYEYVLKYPEIFLWRKLVVNEEVIEYKNGIYLKNIDKFYDFKINKKEIKKLLKSEKSLFTLNEYVPRMYK